MAGVPCCWGCVCGGGAADGVLVDAVGSLPVQMDDGNPVMSLPVQLGDIKSICVSSCADG